MLNKFKIQLKRKRYEYSIGEKELLRALGMEGTSIETIRDNEGTIEIVTTDKLDRLKDSDLKRMTEENPFDEVERAWDDNNNQF